MQTSEVGVVPNQDRFKEDRSSSEDLAPAALLHQIRTALKKIEAPAIG
jgi:hypothetical protein